ncbi:MAG: hypothetical protein LUQ17_04550 [Methanomicrobiales archaeon]|nr:hypothetical protein [Methanomicrobiales archaeon]
MQEPNEYTRLMHYLYGKSLILHNTNDFQPVLHFYFMDALAHIDYTLSILGYNVLSIRNEMSREYLRWRIDEEEKGDRKFFPGFINWLKANHPEKFEAIPTVWAVVYDEEAPGEYRSFRLVLDPDSTMAVPPSFFFMAIDEFFDQEFLKSLYNGNSLARLFESYLDEKKTVT